MFLDRQEEFSKVLVQTLRENQISSTLFSDVCGQRVIVKFGRLEKVSLAKHGFRRSRMSVLKWTKHGQTALLVAGHDPPINITIYMDISINPGPQSWKKIETIITNRTETRPRNPNRYYSNLVQVPLTEPAIVHNNTASLMRCCLLNARSLKNKGPEFVDYICDSEVDIAVITETWLKSGDSAAKIAATPTGYRLLDHPRPNRTGGGTGILLRDSLVIKQARVGILDSFEYSEWTIISGSFRLRLVVIYRPPYSVTHPATVNLFITEFAEFLESVVMTTESILITGDFNIHANMQLDKDSSRFLDLLSSMGLQQHIDFPTHISGNTLDLLITRTLGSNIINKIQPDIYFSDHCSVLFTINISKPQLSRQKISFKKIKAIDTKTFMADLSASRLCNDPPSDPDKLVDCYNTTLADLLERHAPLKTKTVTVRPQVPWYSEEIREAKRERRRSERKWRSTRSAADFEMFKRKKNPVTYLLKEAKSIFLTEFIDQNADSQGKLFRAVKSLLVEKKTLCFSDYQDKNELVNELGLYFVQKVANLRKELDLVSMAMNDVPDYNDDSWAPPVFEEFVLLTDDDVRMLITNSKTTSCCLDPVPTSLLKSCIEPLIPVITKIINTSLESGVFPKDWKETVVVPLLKKSGLDPLFTNLRPVNNLVYISKLAERSVFNQMHDHLVRSDLYPVLQSAYRRYHSTETALLKVRNEILMNMNSQRVTLLVLLDLSAAFDTVDHRILLKRLTSCFGVRGKVLEWFSSYLSGRSQRILFDGIKSKSFDMIFGVPQGSCLGPLLFVMYISKLLEIVQTHLPDAHCFADDTQLYLSFNPNNPDDQVDAVYAMERCISDLRKWMYQDKLKINDDKTEFIIIGSRQQLLKINPCSIRVGSTNIKPVSEVRNLGSWFDSNFSMRIHISKSCGAAFYWLHKRISRFLRKEKLEMVLHAFVTSRIDYCNGLLYSLPDCEIVKLQRVQNAAARLLNSACKYDHITPSLKELHWLPVRFRIHFKILLLRLLMVWRQIISQSL